MYLPGMEFVQINERRVGLLLTMGALAEISNRFQATGPMELAARLRRLSLGDTRELLACLMRPSLSRDAPRMDARRLAAQISNEDLQRVLPKICQMIEHTFRELT